MASLAFRACAVDKAVDGDRPVLIRCGSGGSFGDASDNSLKKLTGPGCISAFNGGKEAKELRRECRWHVQEVE